VSTEIIIADYANPEHSKDLTSLLNCYAKDPMGGNMDLPTYVRDNLVTELSGVPHAFSVLCYVDGKAAGLTNCFQGFSTFNCKPLINVHDLAVLPDYRGLGISQRMLEKVEEVAFSRGCCKITLEVLEGNHTAKAAYLKFGFEGYELDAALGGAMFWQKNLAKPK
jgi:ribosomal protein S18 acetylase RimI-like enzyme